MGLFDLIKKPDINKGIKEFSLTEGAVLLDVRTREEYKGGHIPKSLNIPLDQMEFAKNLIPEKDTPVFVYCLRGSRSVRAVAILKQMGYRNVKSIGGINRYEGPMT